MLLFDGVAGLVMLGLWLFCLIDVIVAEEYACRNLPKMVWLLIVLFLPDVGSILWLIAGRPQVRARPGGLPYKGNLSFSGAPPQATNPDDDEEFLRGMRRRVDEQRRVAREQQRQREQADDGRPGDPGLADPRAE